MCTLLHVTMETRWIKWKLWIVFESQDWLDMFWFCWQCICVCCVSVKCQQYIKAKSVWVCVALTFGDSFVHRSDLNQTNMSNEGMVILLKHNIKKLIIKWLCVRVMIWISVTGHNGMASFGWLNKCVCAHVCVRVVLVGMVFYSSCSTYQDSSFIFVGRSLVDQNVKVFLHRQVCLQAPPSAKCWQQ